MYGFYWNMQQTNILHENKTRQLYSGIEYLFINFNFVDILTIRNTIAEDSDGKNKTTINEEKKRNIWNELPFIINVKVYNYDERFRYKCQKGFQTPLALPGDIWVDYVFFNFIFRLLMNILIKFCLVGFVCN